MSPDRDSDFFPPLAGNPGVEFRGVRYAYLIGSATTPELDGVFLEVWRRDEPNVVVAMIVLSDPDDTFEIMLWDTLPLELVEDAIAVARRNLSPADDAGDSA